MGFQAMIRWFASQKVVAAIFSRIMHRLDMPVIRMTNGRRSLASLMAGIPVVTLTVKGAKSGRPRTLPLLGLPDGESVILIASNWGRKKHPAWYYNLKANPDVTLLVDGRTAPYHARMLEGDEREFAWSKAVVVYAGFEAYKRRASHRHIGVFELAPQSIEVPVKVD